MSQPATDLEDQPGTQKNFPKNIKLLLNLLN